MKITKSPVWLLLLTRHTVSSMVHHTIFSPLLCNGNFTMKCVPLNVADVNSSAYVVPCGTCQVLTETIDFVGGLNVEGHLQILPPVNVASEISIQAPFIFVQGKLTIDMESESFADRRGSIHIELVEGNGADIQMVPHAENSMACGDPTKCNVGKRPFVVAGGMIDIRAYNQSCPSWTNLDDVVKTGMAQLDLSVDEHPPQPPSAVCSEIAVSQDFENLFPVYDAWDGGFFGGASEYGVKGTAANHYFEVTGQGPRVYLENPECLTPGAQYLFSVNIMLSTLGVTASACSQFGGWKCPQLILKTSSGRRWGRRFGRYFNGKGIDDGIWGTFQLAVTFTEDEVGPSSTNTWAYMYIGGPEASVTQSIDNFLLELAPPATYHDPDQVCAQLLPNGDAESSSGGNIFPFTHSGGRAAVVKENGNSFFRQSGRYAYYNRLEAKINTGCIIQDVVYQISAKVQVHSTLKSGAEIVAGSKQPNGSTHWSTLLLCPESDEFSGFVSCERQLSFSPQLIAATSITLYIRPRGAGKYASTVDWDDLSIQFVEGPVEELLVDPTIHDCWADPISKGAEVLLTSHTLDFMDHQVVSASGMTMDGKISLASPIVNQMSGPDDFSVEVALLSRRITLEASSDSGSSIGGHFIVLHTPNVNQTIRGLEIKGFGQQGNLGRYPIHFHMSDNVNGSVVSKNVIRDSHQRCIVVHGTNALLIEDNVAYNTAGHCFTLEDGGEVNNVFRNNLGALTKKVSTLISDKETDDEPSTFWITNPQNSFENNVAAGSEGSGFWFELKTRVRGSSAALHPGVNPSQLPLQYFVGNVAHSNGSGLKTYPGAGYNPSEEAAFIDSKMYRNRGSGIFLHNSHNFLIQGGIFADNRVGVNVDRAHSLRIIGSKFIGVTPSFVVSVSSSGKTGHCPVSSMMNRPVIGVELHSARCGGTKVTGVVLEDLSFAHFGEGTQCPGSSALGVDPGENFGFFDPRHSVKGLTFDADTSKLNLCKAVASGINVAIEDKDASIGSSTGFIVSSNSNMTTFSSCTAVSDASCASACTTTCLRTLSLSVSSLTEEDLKLVIKQTGGSGEIQLSGYRDFRDPYWNTRSYWTRRFFVTLPADRDYQAEFVLDDNSMWPVFVERSWEDQEGCGSDFSLDLDENGPKDCAQLIVNGNAEDGINGWWHTAGGIEVVEGGLSSQSRTYSSWGIAQFLDTRCMVLDRMYTLSASIKLIKDGSAYICVQGPVAYNYSPCPVAWLRSRVGTTNPVDSYHTIATDIITSSTGDWGTMVGTFTVTEAEVNAGSVLLAWHRTPAHVKVILDNITLSCVSGCDETTRSLRGA